MTDGIEYIQALVQERSEQGLAPVQQPSYAVWCLLAQRLEDATHLRALKKNQGMQIADCYSSMEEFWSSVDDVECGRSDGTYWDTYEHGYRRRLEKVLAAGCGCEDALLLNTGMSSIAVALGSLRWERGDRLVTGAQRYFETDGYLKRFIEPTGVEIHKVDTSDPAAFVESVKKLSPKAVLLETVTNVPEVECLDRIAHCFREFPSTPFIIDNSTQSWLTRWYTIPEVSARNLIVLESGTKYVTNDVMCGIVYGCKQLLASVREYARDTGQQLQGRALSYLDEKAISRLDQRLAVHSANVRVFEETLRSRTEVEIDLRSLSTNAAPKGSAIFEAGTGSLLFLFIPSLEAQAYRNLLMQWRAKCASRREVVIPDIRAGFGWLRTSARIYEGTKLNQSYSPTYLRISVGLEPAAAIEGSATCLAEALNALSIVPTDAGAEHV